LRFRDEKNLHRFIYIVDIASGYQSMVVLSGDREVFVWGRRMGVYPQVELTLDAIEKRGMIYN
jgi:alpha-tubulin suppressor-like RCC1 family protein